MNNYTITTPQGRWTRKRRDAAARLFMKKVYETIKANAGLDTHWGKRIYNNCLSHAESVQSNAYSAFDYGQTLPHGAGNITFKGE